MNCYDSGEDIKNGLNFYVQTVFHYCFACVVILILIMDDYFT